MFLCFVYTHVHRALHRASHIDKRCVRPQRYLHHVLVQRDLERVSVYK